MKNVKLIGVMLFILAMVVATSCKKSEPEQVIEKPKEVVKKAPVSPDNKMEALAKKYHDQMTQNAYTEMVPAEDVTSGLGGEASLFQWGDLVPWKLVKPIHDKYLFSLSEAFPGKGKRIYLLPIGNPYHPEYPETKAACDELDPETLVFVQNNAIALWGIYEDSKGSKHYAYDRAGNELPRR